MSSDVVDLAAVAAAIQANTAAVNQFMNQQIFLYTTTDPTVTISDANGNPITVPSYYASIGANAAAVSSALAQVAANTAAIAALNNGDSNVAASITTLQGQQTVNAAAITTLQNNTQLLSTQVSTNSATLSTLSAAITTLQNSDGGSVTVIQGLQSQQATNTANIAALQTSDAANTQLSGANATAIATLQSVVTTIQTHQASDETGISGLTTAVGALQGSVAANTLNITANTSAIGVNTAAITALQLQTGQAATTVTNLSSEQTTLGNTLVSLQAQVTANTTALASAVTLGNSAQFTATQSVVPVMVTQGINYSINAAQSNNVQITVTGDIELTAPLGLSSGMEFNLTVDMDSVGGHAVSFDPIFALDDGTPPLLRNGPSARNTFKAYYDGTHVRLTSMGGNAITGTMRRPVTAVSSASGVVTIDINAGHEVIMLTLTENVTSWVFNNPPPVGYVSDFEVVLKQGASTAYTVASPAPGHTAGGNWTASTTLGAVQVLKLRVMSDGSVHMSPDGVQS
jgi:hypothetical protein